MNKVLLTGRVTAKPELRYTISEVAESRFTLAITRNYKNEQGVYESDFVTCVAYRQNAKALNEWVEKGDRIGIEGSIRTGSYEKDGKKVYTTDILVDRIEFLASRPKEEKVEKTKEEKVEKDPFEDFGNEIEYELPFD